MKYCLSLMSAAVMALALHMTAAVAQQTDVTVPGGATGANVSCLQAGDLTSGVFVGTFLETGPQAWEERLKTDTFKLEERNRDDLSVDLFDQKRQVSIQIDFVNRTVKYKPEGAKDATGDDRYYILNATDKAGSKDCAALAAKLTAAAGGEASNVVGRSETGPSGGTGVGAGDGGGAGGGAGLANKGGGGAGTGAGGAGPASPIIVAVIPPRTVLNISPGTNFTALRGPQCPGRPAGWFICPNQFTCAPPGGVCCPGLGACPNGSFCDRFLPAACIDPSNPRFCGATANANTGLGLHCPPGETCINNFCY